MSVRRRRDRRRLRAGAGGTRRGQAATEPATGDRWPKTAQLDGATYTIYQPQLDSWDSFDLAVHAAVSVKPPGDGAPVFGVLKVTATTKVDKLARTVYFSDLAVQSAAFPSAPNWAASYQQAFQSLLTKGPLTISLDRVEAAMSVSMRRTRRGRSACRIRCRSSSSRPRPRCWSPSTATRRGVACREPRTNASSTRGRCYCATATRSTSICSTASSAHRASPGRGRSPRPFRRASRSAADLGKSGAVDLMEGPADEKTGKKPSLASGVPGVIVVTKPTELIVTDGAPDWVGLDGTGSLLYVKNTDANVFTDLETSQNYVLVSGRWFAAKGLNGPWSYVAAKDLPPAFARIPDDSPKENVKASIPGTAQAKEALIATQIPQTAQVDRAKATYSPQLPGAPDIKPIDGTQLKYVVNSSVPLIQVPGGAWFALQKAVWFTAPTLQGPWSVATSVPAEIYAIPPSSPVYYATYVRIYDSTPTTVTVGYLPGYMGTYVTDGTVVYGTGYVYAPYIGTTSGTPHR